MGTPRNSRGNSTTDPNSASCSPRKPLVRDSQKSKKGEKSKQPGSTDIVDNPNLSEDESATDDEKKASVPIERPNFFNLNYNRVAALVLVTALSLAIYFGSYNRNFFSFDFNAGEDMTSAPDKIISKPNELIKGMQNSFPLQTKDTWIRFYAALSSVTEENPSQPAVLLFVGGNTANAKHTMQCIAVTLATNTNKLLATMNSANADFRRVTIEVDEIINLWQNEEAIKNELDTQIHSILNQSFSVVLGPVERIPPQAALLLHGYCDNFMAPFKKSVIILTTTFESNRPVSSTQLDQKLHELWDSTLGTDKSASIVSRVANSVVFIETETGSLPCTDKELV